MSELPGEYQQAVAWDSHVNQTAQRLRDDLGKHDAADLSRVISGIDRADMPYVQGRFKGRDNIDLKTSILDDKAINETDKQSLAAQIDSKDELQHLTGDDNKYPPITQLLGPHYADERNLVQLIMDSAMLKNSSYLAFLESARAEINGSAANVSFWPGDRREYAAQEQVAKAELSQTNLAVRGLIGGFSNDEFVALHQFTADKPNGDIFKQMLNDEHLSAETKDFIRDRAKAAGLTL